VRALVLGGGGFVGTAACKELMRRGVETVAAGRRPRPYGTFTSYRAIAGAGLQAVLAEVAPDVVLDAAGVERLEFAGRWVSVACGGAEPVGVAIRTGAAFGPDDPSLRIARYIEQVEAGGPVEVPEGRYQEPLALAWVRDVGFACALACTRPDAEGVYDIAFDGVSVEALVGGIARALGRGAIELRPAPGAAYAEVPARGGVERARELGFRASTLEDALADTLAWYRVRSLRGRAR
jgi:nucleoside-diphosphate-sugar epimerase